MSILNHSCKQCMISWSQLTQASPANGPDKAAEVKGHLPSTRAKTSCCWRNAQHRYAIRVIIAILHSSIAKFHLVEEVKSRSVVAAAIHRVDGEEAVGGLDEEAAQALDDAGADPDVGAAPVKLRLQLRRAQQRRLQEEVVPAHMTQTLTKLMSLS